jgi:hypothetical protein
MASRSGDLMKFWYWTLKLTDQPRTGGKPLERQFGIDPRVASLQLDMHLFL